MENLTIWEQLMKNADFKKSFDEYNKSIGNSLVRLKERKTKMEGRDTEIEELYNIMERPVTPIALLLGSAGSGKSALVEEFARQVNTNSISNSILKHKYVLISLRLGMLSSLGNNRLQRELAQLLNAIKYFERMAQKILNDNNIKFVLFIDEVHMIITIFGPGTKIGGDVFKDVLARSPIRVIAATTHREYDSTIVVDKPLSERFKVIEIKELTKDIVRNICMNWWNDIAPDCRGMINFEIIDRVLDVNAQYRYDSAEPRRSLDIMEDFVSYCRRTGKPITHEVVNRLFKSRYSINLSFVVDPDKVFDAVANKVKGQPFAMFNLKKLLRTMTFQLEPTSNRPILTLLMTGPTGVGKALPDTTILPVPTRTNPSGYTKLKYLKVGDYVFDENGNETQITGVFPQGKRNVTNLTLTNGKSQLCDLEHLWEVKIKDQTKILSTKEIQELLLNNVPVSIISNGSIQRNDLDLSDAEIQILYILFNCNYDGGAVLLSKTFVQKFLKIKDCYEYENSVLVHNVEKLLKEFYDFDINNSNTLFEKLLISSIESRAKLLKLLIVHQTIEDDTRQEDFVQSTRTIILPRHENNVFFERMLSSLGVLCHEDQHSSYSRYVLINLSGEMNCFIDNFSLSIQNQPVINKQYALIEKITNMNKKVDMTCIRVENESHLFLTGYDCIVTHNTETTKQIAKALYPNENPMLFINMPDYKTVESEEGFRKRIGEYLRHTPNAIILLDEFEKAHDSIKDSMLTILDEGLITFSTLNREGYYEVNTVSLRNSIVICTTNAGSKIFENEASRSQTLTSINTELSNKEKSEIEILMKSLHKDLIAEGFKPEMLGRFDRILPYKGLRADALLEITEQSIVELFRQFKEIKNIEIYIDEPRYWEIKQYHGTDVAVFIAFERANAGSPNSGGARAIKRELNTYVKDVIIDAVIDNPGTNKFKIYVSKNSRLYNAGVSNTTGGVIVEPIY